MDDGDKRKPKSDSKLECSFCGKSQREVRKLIAGPSVYACNECVELMVDILAEESLKESRKQSLTPERESRLREAFAGVVGQREAVRVVTASILHHWLSRSPDLRPSNVLLVGGRGVGKTTLGRAALAIDGASHAAEPDRLLGGEGVGNFLGPLAKDGSIYGTVFIDDLAQLCVRTHGELAEHAQRMLVRLLDGGTFSRRRGATLSSKRVMVIAAITIDEALDARTGDIRPMLYDAGLAREIVARFTNIVRLDPLGVDELRVLLERNVARTNAALEPLGVSLALDDSAIDAVLESVHGDPDGGWALQRVASKLVTPVLLSRESIRYTKATVRSVLGR